ncbi:MAG TPA: ATP synthase F1 subunit gamma [Clostridia bacterium]|jgi:F-type H+-transporting ATPase subunit gamma
MRNLKDIKRRIKSISQTRQITKAMQTISISKMRKSLAIYESNMMFFERIRSVMSDIILHSKDVSNVFLRAREGNRSLFVVIASDKGLAGGYNHNVLVEAWKTIEKFENKYIIAIGQIAREFFQKRNILVDIEFSYLTQDPEFSDAVDIVDNIVFLYKENLVDQVYVVYTQMVSSSSMRPQIIKLLPLEAEEITKDVKEEEDKDEYYFKELLYEPSADIVFDDLVPQYLSGVIYGTLVQSVASEHLSRMLAMSSATQNATRILEKLNLIYHRARQENITNQINEIVTSSMK